MIVPMSIIDDIVSLILNDKKDVPARVISSHDDADVICRLAIVPVHGPANIPKSGLKPINTFPFLDIGFYSFKFNVYCDCTAISVDTGVIVTLPELIGVAIA